jgi:hypothetical protein
MTGNSGVMQPGEMQRQTPVCQMAIKNAHGINPMQGSIAGSMTGGGMPLVPPNSAERLRRYKARITPPAFCGIF